MNRGNLEIKLNLINDEEVDMSCFIQVMDPRDGQEVQDRVMEFVSECVEKYHNVIVDGHLTISFGNIYYIIGFVKGNEGQEEWTMELGEEQNITIH
tara:strand:+ start:1013 stop:1300 length:288 start_codon:yes stop_codon:yes gene_type:complete